MMAAYVDLLNSWHLELAITQQGIAKVLLDLSAFDDDLGSIAHVMALRLVALVDTCPFPAAFHEGVHDD